LRAAQKVVHEAETDSDDDSESEDAESEPEELASGTSSNRERVEWTSKEIHKKRVNKNACVWEEFMLFIFSQPSKAYGSYVKETCYSQKDCRRGAQDSRY